MKIFSFKEGKRKIIIKISFLCGLLLILQLVFGGSFFIVNNSSAATKAKMCTAPVDVALVIDYSESMEEDGSPSKCTWQQLELFPGTPPSYQCVNYEALSMTLQECLAVKDTVPFPASCNSPAFIPSVKNKLDSAKESAITFLANLGTNDQSALVSYSNTASLDKVLSTNHASTEDLINAIVIGDYTNIGDAIDLANKELDSTRINKQAVQAMILLTDGRANLPSTVADPEQYAVDKATEAAALGIKIFTIGLGSSINASILANIANITNGTYYFSPTASELNSIYQSIGQEICEYGSISGCKYNDINKDAGINGIDNTESKLDGWEIVLVNGVSTTSQTTVNGCYSFAGLEDGDYTVTEVLTGNWVQNYPVNSFHSVEILGHNDVSDIDFANYLPSFVLSTSTISGYKYNDLNNNGVIDDGGAVVAGWEIDLIECGSYAPLSADELVFLDKSIISTSSPALPGACVIISTTTTDVLGYYKFNDLISGDYGVSEVNESPWQQTLPTNNQFYYFKLGSGVASTTINFANFKNTILLCGDGNLDSGEQCDDGNVVSGDGCSATCASEGGGGSSCGNGTVDSGEQCDDGNNTSGDGCSVACTTEGSGGGSVCGDGGLDSNEQCDDGNNVSGDGCSSSCTNEGGGGGRIFNYCGDRIWQSPNTAGTGGPLNDGYEECDGVHNVPEGFTCNVDCALKPILYIGGLGAELTIVKSVDRKFANQGDKNIEYKITIENIDPVTARQVVIEDTLPDGLVYVDTASSSKSWVIGDIPPFETRTVTYLVNVSENAKAGVYTNFALVRASDINPKEGSADLEIKTVEVLGIELVPTGFEIKELLIFISTISSLLGFSFALRKKRKLI